MSPSIFRIFGILVLAMLVFFVMSKLSGWNDPVSKSAVRFIGAVQQGDQATVIQLLDPKTADVALAGNKLVSVHFKSVNAFQGAFSSQPDALWTFADLTGVQVSTDTPPEIGDTLASVQLVRGMNNGGHILFHRKGTGSEWKIFYISKPENEGTGK